MLISLPNGEERHLDNDVTIEIKLKLCEALVDEFDNDIQTRKDSQCVRYFLNGLANYLCWHKEEVADRDKNIGILSNSREKQMDRNRYHGRYRKDIPFTDLNKKDKLIIFGEMTEDA